VVSPTLPFPLSLPSPFPFPLSFQTNQWEGRSDTVRGKLPGFPPYKYHPASVAHNPNRLQ